MSLRSFSHRTMGPWMVGPTDIVHDDTLEICVLLSGSIHTVRDGTYEVVRAHHCSVIPAGVPHSSWTQSEAIEEIVVHLDAWPEGSRGGVWSLACLGGADALLAARDPAARETAARELLRATLDHDPPMPDPRLQRVFEAVRHALHEPWTVARMASVAAMSERSLGRAFRECVGTSPKAWVLQRRLDRAAQLLTATEQPVTEIALAVGFGPSRLSEAFARRFGAPPSQWRQRDSSTKDPRRGGPGPTR